MFCSKPLARSMTSSWQTVSTQLAGCQSSLDPLRLRSGTTCQRTTVICDHGWNVCRHFQPEMESARISNSKTSLVSDVHKQGDGLHILRCRRSAAGGQPGKRSHYHHTITMTLISWNSCGRKLKRGALFHQDKAVAHMSTVAMDDEGSYRSKTHPLHLIYHPWITTCSLRWRRNHQPPFYHGWWHHWCCGPLPRGKQDIRMLCDCWIRCAKIRGVYVEKFWPLVS